MNNERRRHVLPVTLITIVLLIPPGWGGGTSIGEAQQLQLRGPFVDSFLKLDGIEGESQDDRHVGALDVISWGWGSSQSAGPSGGSAGSMTGKMAAQDFHFSATYSKASPQIFLASADGRHIREAVLSTRKRGARSQDFLTVRMSDVIVTSYQTGAAEGSLPVDQVSLTFSKIEFEYATQAPDGSMGAPVKAGWDVRTNRSN